MQPPTYDRAQKQTKSSIMSTTEGKESDKAEVAKPLTESRQQQQQQQQQQLPDNRFELELEFVQALASPAYLHFLATQRSEDTNGPLLQDPALQEFFRYLRATWSQPEYSRFLQYPHCLYFLDLLIEKPAVAKEWTQTAFRNFCHQQQFLAWQHRHSVCYGVGKKEDDEAGASPDDTNITTATETNYAEETTHQDGDVEMGGTDA